MALPPVPWQGWGQPTKGNILTSWGFSGSPAVKNLPASVGNKGSVPSLGRCHILQSLLSEAHESQVLSLCAPATEAHVLRA